MKFRLAGPKSYGVDTAQNYVGHLPTHMPKDEIDESWHVLARQSPGHVLYF